MTDRPCPTPYACGEVRHCLGGCKDEWRIMRWLRRLFAGTHQ